MNDKSAKEKNMKKCQMEILHIKNSIKYMNNANDWCEERASDLKNNMQDCDDILRNTLKMTRDQENFMQRLLDDGKKINWRLMGVKREITGQHTWNKKIPYLTITNISCQFF